MSIFKVLLLITLLKLSLFAMDTGEFSFLLIKDGKPLANQEAIIYKQENMVQIYRPAEYNKRAEFKTDSDGSIYTVLPIGNYQIQIVAKENGKPLAFAKKNFVIAKDKESQLIMSLNADNTLAYVDAEQPTVEIVAETNTTEVKKIENGSVQITLSSSEDESFIKDARVFVKGLSIDIKTDAKGNAVLTIPQGEQTLSIIHANYSAQTVKVTVMANESIMKMIQLSPASLEMEEFVVLAPQVEGSVAALTAEKKNGSAIAEVLGSEQMSKKGDSNAAAALKRVAGITLVDGKNIYVRGLGERYSNVELNSMHLPSPNPTKRVVPLDIFPSSVIGSLKVQKSFSADIPGNFAGGYIDIRTKEDVNEDYIKVSLAVKAHSSALDGTQGNYYTGGDLDWTGYDTGRAMPAYLLKFAEVKEGEKPPSFDPYATDKDGQRIYSKDDLVAMTKDIVNRKYDTHQDNVPVGFKGALEFAKRINIDDDNQFGILMNYTYDQSHKSVEEEYYRYGIDGAGVIDDFAQNQGINTKTSSTYKQGGMINLNYKFADIFKIKYTSMYLHTTVESTRITDGTLGSNSDMQKYYSLDWEERTLFINQISGKYKFDLLTENNLDFGAQYSMANMYQPNNLKYTYIDNTRAGDNYELQTQSTQNLINHNMSSDDNVLGGYVKNASDIELFSDKDKFEFGASLTSKTRESRSNKFFLDSINQSIPLNDLYQNPDAILDEHVTNSNESYNNMGLLVKTLFAPSDYYDADMIQSAFYIKTTLNPTEYFDFGVGLRKSYLVQTLHEYATEASTGLVQINDNELVVDKYLPNVDARIKFTDMDQLRFSFSQSYIYPDFREFSSSGYFHPDEVATVVGNPNLVSTDITNYDLRFEHYFSPTESISGAVFYKNLDNPIEDVSRPTTSLPIYSYENTENAVLMGLELDAYKNLEFLSDIMEYYYVSGNFSYTHSDVTLSQEQESRFTSNHRTLQGLSPFVLNASVGYDNTEGRSINLSYNLMSERLRKVGLKNGAQEYPDQYEIPAAQLDFTYQEKLTDMMALKLKARNLLDGEIIWKEGENVTKRYQLGRTIEVSMSFKY